MLHHLFFGLVMYSSLSVNEQNGSEFDFDKAVMAIRETQKTKDIKVLYNIAEEARKSLPPSSPALLRITREICSALASVNFKDERQGQFLHTLAVKAVQENKNGPVEYIVPIVQHVEIGFELRNGLVKGADWERSRRARTHLYLHVFRELPKEIDRKFNFDDEPQRNLAPPGGEYPSGISPKSIKEPEIRALYEKALEENSKKAERYYHQRTLLDLEKSFSWFLEQQVSRAYSIEPVNIQEVKADFKEYGIPQQLTDRVVQKLEARLVVLRQREEKLKSLNKPPPPPQYAVGTEMDAKMLSQDPRLQVPIKLLMTKPKVTDILNALDTATKLEITVGKNIPKDRLAFWSIHYQKWPACSVMGELKEAVVDNGRWIKEETGYRLEGDAKPTLETQRGVPPGRPSRLGYYLLGLGGMIAVGLFLYRRRAKKLAADRSKG